LCDIQPISINFHIDKSVGLRLAL